MARQPSGKDAPSEDVESDVEEVEVDEARSAQADAMWSDVRIQPVEIALPKGVGYTLRAYRLSNELTPPEIEEEEDDFAVLKRHEDDLDDEDLVDEDFIDERPGAHEPEARRRRDDGDDEVDSDVDEVDADADELDEDEEPDDSVDEDEAEEEEEEEPEPEEVPAFLGHHGKLLLFRSVEGLVEFVKSDDAEHDLTQLDSWDSVKTRITASAVVPSGDDRYELDLVVENLRGGHDAWDSDLLIAAGEVARDLAYALRIEAVRTALSPGSPLDDLDEALRGDANGGLGGFFARRRLKKIGAQQAALGWRTIIGKISAAVDWRD